MSIINVLDLPVVDKVKVWHNSNQLTFNDKLYNESDLKILIDDILKVSNKQLLLSSFLNDDIAESFRYILEVELRDFINYIKHLHLTKDLIKRMFIFSNISSIKDLYYFIDDSELNDFNNILLEELLIAYYTDKTLFISNAKRQMDIKLLSLSNKFLLSYNFKLDIIKDKHELKLLKKY